MGDSSNTPELCPDEQENKVNLVSDNLNTSDKFESDQDDRVKCSNSKALDKIFEVVVENINKLADAANLKESKPLFIHRFKEVFKNTLQENVRLDSGLPWVVQKETLCDERKQEQQREAGEALLSQLSKTVETLSHKRKLLPPRVQQHHFNYLSQHFQKVKCAKLDPSVLQSTLPDEEHLPIAQIKSYSKETSQLQEELQSQLRTIEKMKRDANYAQDLIACQNPHVQALYDTGYISD